MAVDPRHRVRRRRTVVLVVSAAVALVAAVGIAVVGGHVGAAGELARAGERSPAGAAADGERVEVLDAWAVLHEGWVLVYADGRVIWFPESGSTLYAEHTRDVMLERRLSADGLARFESGDLSAADVDVVWPAPLPDDLWASADFRPFTPSAYAICAWQGGEGPRGWMHVAGVLDELPPVARSVLRGTERPFTGYEFDAFQVPDELLGPVTCFGVTPPAAEVVVGLSERPSQRYRAEGDLLTFTSRLGDPITLVILPVMPHGQFVIWGG